MKESVPFIAPRRLKLNSNIRSNIKEMGGKSTEKEVHSDRIQCKISCYYRSNLDIPDGPLEESIETNQSSESAALPISIKQESIEPSDFEKVIEIELKREEEKSQLIIPTPEKLPLKGILKRSQEELDRISQKAKE